jgi:hypothetical protein
MSMSNTKPKRRMRPHPVTTIGCVLALCAQPVGAADDVQRQIQQREQQQMELRLKMQQQVDRAAQPPQSSSAALRQRQLERDQQQRLQQSHDRDMRGTVAPAQQQGDIEQRRAGQAGAEQLNRFGTERRMGTDSAGTQGGVRP